MDMSFANSEMKNDLNRMWRVRKMASSNKDKLIFGLDIGTRSLVGSVGYMNKDTFVVVGHYVKEHDSRSMLDGQIHDIVTVSESIQKVKRELEKQLDIELKEVCIAAAGRVLKTKNVHVELERKDDQRITAEEIYDLETLGVKAGYEEIAQEVEGSEYYCVGYSVIKYFMNDQQISNLEGHKAGKISCDMVTTFLPNDVVDGLYTAVEDAGLTVANLTLEPIAAINLAIPQNYRLLNIALVDVGAGTSDISITKDGSIIAYGMIPHAGDEITETIVQKYLVDFNTADKIKIDANTNKSGAVFKDVMGLEQKVSKTEVANTYKDTVKAMTKEIADKIIELNGGKTVSACFVVGGGGKAHGFCDMLASALKLPKERVALRGEEVLSDVEFTDENVVKDPLLVTPIGICLNYYAQHNNFIIVNVNDARVKLFDNGKLNVLDAAIQVGFPDDALFGKRGEEINYTVNGVNKVSHGGMGEPAEITVNNQPASMITKIVKNDVITIKPSTKGDDAVLVLEGIEEYGKKISFMIDDKPVRLPRCTTVNGEIVPPTYVVKDGDKIEVLDYYTVSDLAKNLDIPIDDKDVYVNNEIADPDTKVYERFKVVFKNGGANATTATSFSELPDDDGTYEKNKEATAEVAAATAERIKKELEEKKHLDPITGEPLYKSDEETVDSEEESNDSVSMDNENKNERNVDYIGEEKFVPDRVVKMAATGTTSKKTPISVNLSVNGKNVTLKNKSKYSFVDILDFYPFDTKNPKGNLLVTRINGEECKFSDPVKDGDTAELYWK